MLSPKSIFPLTMLSIVVHSSYAFAEQAPPVEVIIVSGSHSNTDVMALDSNVERINQDDIEPVIF